VCDSAVKVSSETLQALEARLPRRERMANMHSWNDARVDGIWKAQMLRMHAQKPSTNCQPAETVR
jgi:hypothetical protein